MLKIIEENGVWCGLGKQNQLECEDGTVKELGTHLVEFTHGKYKGQKLSEVSDTSYLKWMHDQDYFLKLMADKRLKELE